MLTDVLGALLGFSVVMLLFSLVVTALVQATQSMLRMRNRSLRRGMTELLADQNQLASKEAATAATTDGLLSVAGPARTPTSITEIDDDEFATIVGAAHAKAGNGKSPSDKTALDAQFQRLQRNSSDRFTLWVRWITIGWAAVIACTYQISAPELFNRLLEDPEYRERAIAAVDQSIAEAEAHFASAAEPPEDIRLEALSNVADDNPGLVPALSTRAEKTDFIAALELAYEGDADGTANSKLLGLFDVEESKLHQRAMDGALARASSNASQLSVLGFGVGAGGPDFYHRPANWLGMFMSAILLSLGAPFWYQQVATFKMLNGIFGRVKGDKS